MMIRSTQQKQDSLLAKRFAVVVLTDFLCWAPIVTTKVLAMTGKLSKGFDLLFPNLLCNTMMHPETFIDTMQQCISRLGYITRILIISSD